LPARAERVDGDWLTESPAGHAGADLSNAPRELVPEHLAGLRHSVLDRVHVGPAEAAGLDSDDNLARPSHWVRNVSDLRAIRHAHHSSHATPPIRCLQ
jgi:hypothetical protein